MNLLDKIKSLLNIESEESKPTDTTAVSDASSYESNSSDSSGNGTVDRKSDAEPTRAAEADATRVPNVEEAETNVEVSTDGQTGTATAVKTDSKDESEPKTTESEPKTTESEPKTTESEPKTTESETETDGATSETDGPTVTETGESEPVDVIKGVGTTYAERLGEAGIETVDDLAAAESETVADETDISVKRIERWVGRAEHR
ncbi:helix-hairpin-helix domain-containing protein [Halocatena pleomorpha]|uniref:Helix-hairpin-helix domain-containing protein n=1 Tax=Halocatena pleomorpha TaxID=1785090 RepID=A0A3P3RBN9_9EURY|nr:helix-hairpin-helix domain-containing protein [Halocatena pleomorpha]RRJ30892.1 hypothetical protein EIK79_08720 [Halocatena pleomorpha]